MRPLALLLACCPAALLAEDIPLTSDVTAVTLYPSGATITREVPFSASEGTHQLILTDLPPSTPLESVRVSVEGAVMGSVTSRSDFVPPRTDATNAVIEAAEAKVEEAEADLRAGFGDVQAIRLEVEAANARVTFLNSLGDSENVTELGVDALRDLAGMIGEETLTALQAAHAAEQKAGEAERDLKDLKEALDMARKELQALVPEVEDRAMLAIAINAATQTEGMVEVTYNIHNAGWLPVYDLKLDRSEATLAIERGAFVSQNTGENWRDVTLTLSTVRPSEQTDPGQVWPWLRRIYDPKEQLTKSMTRVEAEMDVFAGAIADAAPMEEPMMVEQASAEFDGLAVTYDYPGSVSVASGADRVRLALGSLSTDVDLTARAVPLSDDAAFLMASFTNDMGELILPTHEAMVYLDGRFVGQRYLDLIASGDEAEVSFGPIDGLRLTRTVLDRNEGDRGILSKSNEFTEEVRIEVQNLTGESWPVELRDHVPYSEQEDLEITWEASPRPDAEDIDGKRGVLSWSFDLPAGDTQTIELSHGLEWPDGMVLQ